MKSWLKKEGQIDKNLEKEMVPPFDPLPPPLPSFIQEI